MKRLLISCVVVGALAGAALPATASGAPPRRVTGVSFLLDVATTGNDAGLGLVYNLATSTLFLVVPPKTLPGATQGVVLKAVGVSQSALDQFQAKGSAYIAKGRAAAAPLAALNGSLDLGVEAAAEVLDFLGQDEAQYTGPFDVTLVQLAAIARTLEEPPKG